MKKYLEKYYSRIMIMGLFVFLIHGAKLHSGIIGIDTEDIIHLQGDFYGGWINTGRQGLYLLKWLMHSLSFQPYMAGLCTLLFMAAAVSSLFLLWDKILWQKMSSGQRKAGNWAWVAGGLFLIAHPVITEQFYFTLQSVEICIGFLLSAVSLYLIAAYREKGSLWRAVISCLLLLLTFSTYQAFVSVFIFGTITVLLLEGIARLQSGEEVTGKELLKGLIPYVCVFTAAFVVNTIITKLFFSISDYLGGQILWGKFDIMDNFRAIVGHIVKVLTGYGSVHYHFSFGVLCIAAAWMVMTICVRYGKKQKKKGSVPVILFYLAALFVSPFLMTLVCGGAPVIRSQLVLPLLTGFLAYLVISLPAVLAEGAGAEQSKKGKFLPKKAAVLFAGLLCIVGIWSETATTMSFYYTDEMRYRQDEALGRELITEIDRIRGEQKLPVAVVGRKPFSGNNACVIGEIIGKSFFDHDTEVEPQYYWSTRRILGFLHVLGSDYLQADKGRFADVVNYSMNMPVWPAEGSVQIYDGMIVVKLSGIE